MENTKLDNFEAIALLVLIMTNKIILNLPKTILGNVGTSAWINTIYISILAILFAIFICFLLSKFPGQDILDISEFLGGKLLRNTIAFLYVVFFIINAVLIVRSFSESIKIIYFDSISLLTIIVFFIATTCIANVFGLKVISKTNLIIAPLVLVSIFVIIFSSVQDFVPQRLLPILGHGINETFIHGTSNIFLFSIFAYIFLLPPMVKNLYNYKKVVILSVIISSLYLISNVVCLQLVFPFIYETQEHLSVYLLIRMSKGGDIIQRFISVFFFVWILSVLCYMSISLFFSVNITKQIAKLSNSKYLFFCFGFIIIGASLIVGDYSKYIFFIEKLFKPSVTFFLFGINIFILVLAFIKLKIKNRRNKLYEKSG